MTEQELLKSIADYNDGLSETSTKAELTRPSVGADQNEAKATLKRLRTQASQVNTKCMICEATITDSLDRLGRKVRSNRVCGLKCTATLRALVGELLCVITELTVDEAVFIDSVNQEAGN